MCVLLTHGGTPPAIDDRADEVLLDLFRIEAGIADEGFAARNGSGREFRESEARRERHSGTKGKRFPRAERRHESE